MRKLGRMVRRVLTAVSLLLFVAVLAAWVRGYWSWDSIEVSRESLDQTRWRKQWHGRPAREEIKDINAEHAEDAEEDAEKRAFVARASRP